MAASCCARVCIWDVGQTSRPEACVRVCYLSLQIELAQKYSDIAGGVQHTHACPRSILVHSVTRQLPNVLDGMHTANSLPWTITPHPQHHNVQLALPFMYG